jgi:hypothetical protein
MAERHLFFSYQTGSLAETDNEFRLVIDNGKAWIEYFTSYTNPYKIGRPPVENTEHIEIADFLNSNRGGKDKLKALMAEHGIDA